MGEAYHVLDGDSKITDFDDESAIKAACDQLCSTIKKMAPEIAASVADPPPQEQIEDCIRVGNSTKRAAGNMDYTSKILVRDWLSRELDKRKNQIVGEKATAVQAAYRGVHCKHIYQNIQGNYTKMRTPLRQFIAKILAHEEEDSAT